MGQMEAKAEGRVVGKSRWPWSAGAGTAGVFSEAEIKGMGMWQMAEWEEKRAQAHSAALRWRWRVSRVEQMGWCELQVQGGVQ